MSQILEIKELDVDTIEPSTANAHNPSYTNGGSKITVIGRPGSGKTKLITSLIYEKRYCFPVGVVMSGTEDSNHHYSSIFPSIFVYNGLNIDGIKDFIKRQKVAKQYVRNPWGLLLLDDCADEPKLFNTPLFQGLYKNGRHWSMLFILSLQYCMDVKPVIRTNIDGVFILREPSVRTRKAIYENYASIIPTFDLFCTIMDQITTDWTALYINNRTQSNDWQDCVFWYKAKPVPSDWKFGCDWYKQYHKDRFNTEYKENF
jgi:hypothetical protein